MTETTQTNPLSGHFRQPALFLKLPSNGKFWPEGSLELSATGEIPVLPLTVKDEITLKTPDALLNGSSTSSLISSCCPSIKDTAVIPAVDLDPILIAIRIASYGAEMEITAKCKHCDKPTDLSVDLVNILDSFHPVKNYDQAIEIDNMQFQFKPQTFEMTNKTGMATFEQQKLVANILGADVPDDDKKEMFQAGFYALSDLNLDIVVSSIASITTEDDTVVTDEAFIKEYLANCDKKAYDKIRNVALSLAKENALKPFTVTCGEEDCGKQFETKLEFEHSNFFA